MVASFEQQVVSSLIFWKIEIGEMGRWRCLTSISIGICFFSETLKLRKKVISRVAAQQYNVPLDIDFILGLKGLPRTLMEVSSPIQKGSSCKIYWMKL